CTFEEGTTNCAGDRSPYLQFALKQPEFIQGLRLRCAYPAAAGRGQLRVFWRETGRNDFTDKVRADRATEPSEVTGSDRCYRLTLPAGTSPTVTIPVNDTVTDVRLYPDGMGRADGYYCVFRLDQIRLLVRPADAGRLVREYAEVEVPLPLVP